MKKYLFTHWPAIITTIIAIITGLLIYKDYGLSWDEESQRWIGLIFHDYAKGQYPDFQNFDLKDHGPGFEWILIFIEKAFKITNFRDIFLMRHLVTYIIFVLCMFSGYVLAYSLFKNRWIALFVLTALLFNPRLFAHSFFNPKDIPGMSMFLLSIATARWAFAKNKILPYLILGLICGYSACVRLMNIVVLIPFALFFIMDIIEAFRQKGNPFRVIIFGVVLVSGFAFTLIVSWPALWENPLTGFAHVYNSYKHFNWPGYMLFNKVSLFSFDLPWSYIPTWMFLTIPEMWLLLAIIGMVLFAANFTYAPFKYLYNSTARNYLLAFICFLLPLVIIIKLNSVLYDGWRHMYFIYPPFIILAAYGLNELLKNRPKWILWSLCALQMLLVGRFIIKSHPYQQVYFNSFIGDWDNNIMHHYELDYWGASVKQAYEWIAEHDDRDVIVTNNNEWIFPIVTNYNFLPENIKQRFSLSFDKNEWDYVIEVFRTKPYNLPNDEFPDAEIVYEARVLGSPIYRIVKIH